MFDDVPDDSKLWYNEIFKAAGRLQTVRKNVNCNGPGTWSLCRCNNLQLGFYFSCIWISYLQFIRQRLRCFETTMNPAPMRGNKRCCSNRCVRYVKTNFFLKLDNNSLCYRTCQPISTFRAWSACANRSGVSLCATIKWQCGIKT